MKVEPPTEEGETGEEDDISEPDEDTIAGQMALMKGQAVKRSHVHDDEEGSGSEEDSDEDSSDESSDESSDSDSDSD